MRKKNRAVLSDEALCAEYDAVYRYALTLCKSETEAGDITQETFLRAMKSKDGFEGSSSLYTWLCAIAKNLWFTKYAKNKREVSADFIHETEADPSSLPDETAADRDTSMRLHRILHSLDEPYKEVFSLRVFGQLSFAEISGLFGKTESWARVTYHRAKKMIIEQAGKEGLK